MERARRQHHTDWICADCGNDVFGSKDKCGKCGLFRSKSDAKNSVNKAITRKPGDWDCACGEINFASRLACHKCNVAKSIPNTTPAYRPGDWFCTGCNELNFGSRDACFKCGCNRANHNERKDSSCVVCLVSNKNVTIKTCGHFAMCDICAQKMDRCPMCRREYEPARDLLRTFDVAA